MLGGAAVVLAALVVLRNDGSDSVVDLVEQSDPGPVHVHGLGVNPSDRSLMVATHTGLWRVAPRRRAAQRVGDSRQDTMGFTVVGPDHFFGSGHPATGDQPPLLGLIESTDAGHNWQTISLSGEADFHVLRAYGETIYGFDASNGRFLESADGGVTWDERHIPQPFFDLVAAPGDPARIVAAGERGLWAARGDGWVLRSAATGLLGWPRADRLYLVDGAGRTAVSGDGGMHWRPLTRIGGQPAAFAATTANELYVALHDGTIKVSRDGGRTWRVRSAP